RQPTTSGPGKRLNGSTLTRAPESLTRLSATVRPIRSNAKPARKPLKNSPPSARSPRKVLNRPTKSRLRKKARATERDDVRGIVITAAKKVLADIQRRSTEAIKALDQHDYLVVLGALAGLEEHIRFVTVRLMVLCEIEQIQKQNLEQRRKS